jgi:hypothetical protein
MATRCTDPSYRMQENERNAQAMATSHTNPAHRRQEQISDTNHRRLTRQTNPPEIRAQENERNTQVMATSHTNPAYRRQEQIADTNHRKLARQTNPAYRRQEQFADTNHRRLAREQPFFMTWQLSLILLSCTYLYNQPCVLWNEESHHGLWVHSSVKFIKFYKKEVLCKWCSVFC